MEEDMDDFGDIYADVEGYAAPGVNMIPSIRQLYLEDRAKAELSSQVGDDSGEEERLLYDRIVAEGRPEGSPQSAVSAGDSMGFPGQQPVEELGGSEVVEESDESDSDDGLRIVLNEEDCKRLERPRRRRLGIRENLAGAIYNEEDESLTAATRDEQPFKEPKWVELSQLPVKASEHGGPEKYGTSMGSYTTQHVQFKYVRPRSAGWPSNTKGTGRGCAVPLSLSMTSKGDWNTNGRLATTSCSVGFPVQRNRTLFDISIEMFDQKPWRDEGLDVSDYFNFGLNEETWKEYCHDMPKGQAIKVEGGSGERLPSVDTRRPRYQDSDAVIQVLLEGSSKDAMILQAEKSEHGYSAVHSENEICGGYKMDEIHGEDDNGGATSCHKNEEAGSIICTEPNEEPQHIPESHDVVNDKAENMFSSILQSTSASVDELLNSSDPSSPESVYEASRDGLSADKLCPAKGSSFCSVSGSDISVGSSDNTTFAYRRNTKSSSYNHDVYLEEQREPSETEFCNVVGKDAHNSTNLSTNGKTNLISLRLHKNFAEESSCKHLHGEYASPLAGIRMSKNTENRECSQGMFSMSSYTAQSCRNKLDSSSNAKYHRRNKCYERRDIKYNEVKQVKRKMSKKDEVVSKREFLVHKGTYRRFIPDHLPYCTENDQSGFRRPRKWDELDNICKARYKEHHLKETYALPYLGRNESSHVEFDRNAPCRMTRSRDNVSRQRGKHEHLFIGMDNAHRYIGDDSFQMSVNHRSSDDKIFTGSPYTNEMMWPGSSLSKSYELYSQRQNDSYDGCLARGGFCGIPGERDTRFYCQRGSDLLDPCTDDSYNFSYKDYKGINSGCYRVEERGGHSRNARRKNSHMSHPKELSNDQKRHRQRIIDDFYFTEAQSSCKRNYRHENSFDNHQSVSSMQFLHNHSVTNENGTRISRERCLTKEKNSVKPRESVNGYLDGYGGKFPGKSRGVTHREKKISNNNVDDLHRLDEVCLHRDPGKQQKMDRNRHVIQSTVKPAKQHDSDNLGAHFYGEYGEPKVVHNQDVSGLEEGQIVELDDVYANTEATKETPVSISMTRLADDKEKQVKDNSNSKKPGKEYDDGHILETLVKMEKRRERFKEPIVQKEQRTPLGALTLSMMSSDEVKLERPARKRRWAAVANPLT